MVLISFGAAQAADVIESIVCKVNGEIVTRSEIDRLRDQVKKQLDAQGIRGADAAKILQNEEKNLLRDKIDELLMIQKAKEESINVDSEVSRMMGEIQKKSGIVDPDKFATWVKEQTGKPYEDYRTEMKNNLLIQHLVGQEVQSKLNIPKADMDKYYEEHKTEFVREEQVFLREIFISSEDKEGAELARAEAKAKDVVARARKGEKFLDLVRDNSDAPSREQGGEIGGQKRGQMDKIIEDLVWDKPKNYITDPIKRSNGWEILRVEDHVRQGQATREEADYEIRQKLAEPLFQPKMREYLTKLRTEAYLEIREGWTDSGGAPGQNTNWQDPATLKPQTVHASEVAEQSHLKRLLWMVPIPGTRTTATGKSSSR